MLYTRVGYMAARPPPSWTQIDFLLQGHPTYFSISLFSRYGYRKITKKRTKKKRGRNRSRLIWSNVPGLSCRYWEKPRIICQDEVFACTNWQDSPKALVILRFVGNFGIICILLLLHSLVFFRFLFYEYMFVIYVFLLEEAMYSYWYLCILIVSLCYSCLCVVYVFLDAATLTGVFRAFSSVVRQMPR